MLSEISEIKKLDGFGKIREIVRLNFMKENFDYSEKTIEYLIQTQNKTYDELCLFYIKLKKEENLPEGYDTQKTKELLQKILKQPLFVS